MVSISTSVTPRALSFSIAARCLITPFDVITAAPVDFVTCTTYIPTTRCLTATLFFITTQFEENAMRHDTSNTQMQQVYFLLNLNGEITIDASLRGIIEVLNSLHV